MSKAQTIKSYLIGLGFEVDTDVYKKFMGTIKSVDDKVKESTSLMSSSWVKSGAIVTGAMLTIVASTVKLLDSLAKADLGYQKFAMHMFMAKDQAKQFKIVTDAMGESIEDIRWIPELQKKFAALKSDVVRMELPKQYEEEMAKIRGISNEFTRMRVESTYSLQWIGYHLMTKLANPISKIKESFAAFNDRIIKNMPAVAEKIAKVLGPILEIIVDVGRAIWLVVEQLGKLWDSFSPEQRAIVALFFIGLFVCIFPVTAAIVGLIAVISEMFALFEGKRTLIPSLVLKGIAIHVDVLVRSFEALYMILELIAITIGSVAAQLTSLVGGILNPTTLPMVFKEILAIRKGAEEDKLKVLHMPKGLGIIERLAANKVEDPFTWTDQEREEAQANALAGKGHTPNRGLRVGAGGAPETDEKKIAYWKKTYNTLPPSRSAGAISTGAQDVSSVGGTGLPIGGTTGKPGIQTISNEDIMRQAEKAAKELNTDPSFIYSQWYTETGGFKQYKGRYNLGNLKDPSTGTFKHFSSLDDSTNFYISQIKKNWTSVQGAKTIGEFNKGLSYGQGWVPGERGAYADPGKPGAHEQYLVAMRSNLNRYAEAGGRGDSINNVVNMTVNISGVKGADEAVNRFKQATQRALQLMQPPVSDFTKKSAALSASRS